jgi:glycosyltransferase involved in cell wall biosynthesis
MEKLIKQFNKKDTLIVISSYPEKNSEPAKQNAVACYAQNLLRAYKNKKIVVLSEKLKDSKVYKEDNVLSLPTWIPASPFLFLELLRAIHKFNRAKNVLIQFEFNMLGSFVHSALLPVFNAILMLLGKRVVVMQHQVVENLADLSGHLNIKKGTVKNYLLTLGLRTFYRLLGLFSKNIIVHEDILKTRLAKWVREDKIEVISHGLNLERSKNKTLSRKELGIKEDEFVILLFGYITWYKGSDWLIQKIAKLAKTKPDLKLKLIVAGGESATLNSKAHYRAFVKKVKKMAQIYKDSVVLTGFVPEREVALYFSACDLAVLPYRAMMSASGPLSFALRFAKPFIVSNTLASAFDNPDVKKVLASTGIDAKDLVFSLKGKSFNNLITRLAGNRGELKRISLLSKKLRSLRTWESIVAQYDSLIYVPEYIPVWTQIKARFSDLAFNFSFSRG